MVIIKTSRQLFKMKIKFIIFFCLASFICFGQKPKELYSWKFGVNKRRDFSLLVAYNGWTYSFAELGFAINQYGQDGDHLTAWAYHISSEIKIDDNLMMGYKIGAWTDVRIFAVGVNTIYYTNFASKALRLRPEIGFGFGKWKIVYGYNVPLTNREFFGINRNNIAVAYLFKLKRIKSITR